MEINKWILKFIQSVFMFVILLLFVYYIYPGPGYAFDTIIAIAIVLILFLFHELLHYIKAKKLGYEVEWYTTTFMAGFEIDKRSRRQKWIKDKKQIGLFPYYFIIPASIVILSIGIIISNLGISIAGFASLLLHGISFSLEGKEIQSPKLTKK